MAGGIGNAKTNATQEPQILSVQVTTSLYNTAIPLLIGKRRVAGCVVWYGYFGPSNGSGKKGKSGKKGGPTTYQSNLDLLISFGPIWNVQAVWNNSNIIGYASGLSSFSQAGSQTFTVTSSATASGSVSNQPGGYNLDFISAISFTPSSPLSATIDDYGDPQGSHSITETESEMWLYNTYTNYSSSGPASVAWRPGSWEFGVPYCNNPSCTFPIGVDHGGANWTATFPTPVTGTITVYWGATKASHDTPLTYIQYEFEPELGSGNEYSGSLSSQQVLYPELSGCGGVNIDLGASGTAPELDIECQGLYSLTKEGQANPADVILDLILSGNIFFGNGSGGWTPLCFSHGLNFGGDPTRESFSGFDGSYPGAYTWPPMISFPWVLPNAQVGIGQASGAPFQILKDPPTFNQGTYNAAVDYNVNSIVEYSSVYYRALAFGNSRPTSGNPIWAVFTPPFSDGLSDVRNYCAANQIFVSLYLNSQRSCSDILNEICEIANCVPVWNGQTLDFYPYSEVSAVGGGYQYTPRTASGPVVTLDSNYFAVDGAASAPVVVKQENMQSVVNIIDINYTDAGFDTNGMAQYQGYQSTSVRICDAEHCQLYGPMNGSPRGYDDYICDVTTATNVGWPIMNRQRFADTYSVEISLPATVASLLDPMDLITINDPLFGGTLTTGVVTSGPAGQDCRITELSEDKNGIWALSCERFMYGMSAPQAPNTTGGIPNPPPSLSATAGSVNTPYFFEPTAALALALGMTADGGLGIAVSGSSTNYGGCVVNVSTDGGTSYNAIGRVMGNPNMGVTITADYPNHANPDSSDTLYVDLTESLGELVSYTSGQQTQLIPIALLDGGGTGSAAGYTTTIPYEVIAYQDTTLTATHKYSAAPPILRGQLGSVPADHPIGSVFVDLSSNTSIFKYQIPSGSIVGNTLYFKFQTVNQYGTAIQDISDCTAYTFALTGATNPTSPTSPTGGGSYTVNPSPCLYQGKTGGWPGIDGSSSGWTNPNNIYFPPLTVNFGTGAVTYSADDSGTTAFTGSGQTVFVCIYDPSHAGGTPTVDIQSTNVHATAPGYIYLGTITSTAAGTSGGTAGSGGTGGPQDTGSQTYAISVNGTVVT